MVYNKCIHQRRRRRQRIIFTFPFLILIMFKSLYCVTHAAEQDDVFINTFKATYKILTLKTSFITSKKTFSYTKDDWAMLDEAFQFFMVDVQASYQHKQHGHNRRNIRSLVTRRMKMNTNAMLHPSSAFVTVLRSCPVHYSPTMFHNCREAAAKYDIMVSHDESDEDGVENLEAVIEKYANDTKAAIDDGLLQKSLNTLYPGSGITIIGSSDTVASHFATHDRNTILTIQNSFCTEAVNEKDLVVLKEALQELIVFLVLTIEGDEFWNTKLVEDSFEVDAMEPLQPCQSAAHNSTFPFCQTLLFRYNLIIKDAKQPLNHMYDVYSISTNKAIYDGTLQQILKKKDPSKSLMVLEPPSNSGPKMLISSGPRGESSGVPLGEYSTDNNLRQWIATSIGVGMVVLLWSMFRCSLDSYKKEKLKDVTDEEFDHIVSQATFVLSEESEDGWD